MNATDVQLQRQLQNCKWIDADAYWQDRLIAEFLQREPWFAPLNHRTPMTTPEQVRELLATGVELRYGDDWWYKFRAKPKPRPELQPPLVRCDCGHSVMSKLVMSASLGTSCADCYDRMSD